MGGKRERAAPRYSELGSYAGPPTEKRGSTMTPVCRADSQLLQLFPLGHFARLSSSIKQSVTPGDSYAGDSS